MLSQESTGLIVVDVQGKLARVVNQSDALIANCAALISGCVQLGLPIVWAEQNPLKLGSTVEELQPLLVSHQPISKFAFNACDEPRFIQQVRASQVQSWLVCGIEAHICVYQTAQGLRSLDYDVHVVSDCVGSRSADNKTLALNKLARLGVSITGVEMCLYEMVKDCRSEHFKPILNLIK
jgi:nicotinamidase-related amidase